MVKINPTMINCPTSTPILKEKSWGIKSFSWEGIVNCLKKFENPSP